MSKDAPRKILVIRFSSLGDVLLCTPILDVLRKNFPLTEIHFLTKKICSPILKNNPNINRLILYDGESPFYWRERIQKEGYDFVVDLHNSLRSRLIRYCTFGVRFGIYHKPYFKRWVLIHLKKNLFEQPPPHITERYLGALKPLDIVEKSSLPQRPTLIPVEEIPTAAEEFLRQDTIAMAPGSRWFTKQWPPEYFARLIEGIWEYRPELQVLLLGGKEEREIGNQILQSIPHERQAQLFNGIGEFSLDESFAVLAQCRLLVCNDSSLMHAATALPKEIPVVALFLSTVREFGFYPMGRHSIVLQAPKISCRPCDHKGLARCPKKHFRCGYELKPEQVLEVVRKRI